MRSKRRRERKCFNKAFLTTPQSPTVTAPLTRGALEHPNICKRTFFCINSNDRPLCVLSAYRLKIRRTVLAKGAYIILRQGVALVNIAAHLANKAFLALGFGLGLNILLVLGVGHGLGVGNNPCLGHTAYKHTVCVKVNILLHLKGHKGVNIPS